MTQRFLIAAIQLATFLFLVAKLDAQVTDRSLSRSDTKERPESNGLIKAGYGTHDFYIGMPENAFGEDWERTDSGYLVNRNAGIVLIMHDARVLGLVFNYKETPRQARYKFGTDREIGPSNSIVDVQSAYGEPSNIDLTIDHQGNAFLGTVVDVYYHELGIHFQFYNGKLAAVFVRAPRKDFDYDRYRRAMEQSLVYIRQPATP